MNLQSDQKREGLELSLTFVTSSCNKFVLESDEMLVCMRIYALTGTCFKAKYVHIICICIVCLNLSCIVNYTVLALPHPQYCSTKTSSTCSLHVNFLWTWKTDTACFLFQYTMRIFDIIFTYLATNLCTLLSMMNHNKNSKI